MPKRLISILLSALLLLSLAACGEEAPEPEDETHKTEQGDPVTETVAADTVFTVNCIYGSGLNPFVTRNTSNQMFLNLVYDRLFELDSHFNLTSDFVKEYYSEDGLLWVFKLDLEGMTFHNGDELNAYDVSYSIMQSMNSGLYKNRMADVMGVSATDKATVLVSLNNPNMLFPYRLTIPIIEYGTVTMSTPPGTGPYMYAYPADPDAPEPPAEGEAEPENTGIPEPTDTPEPTPEPVINPDRLVPFENYHLDGCSPIDVIYLAEYSSAEEMTAAFENSLLDLVVNDRTGSSNLGFGRANEKRYVDTLNMHYIGFNTEESYPQFTNHRVAISYAVNREYICSYLMDDCGAPAISPIHPNNPLYPAELAEPYGYSRERLMSLFDTAEIRDYDEDGFRDFMVGGRAIPIELDFIVCSDSSLKTTIAETIADELGDVGIKVNVRSLVWEQYIKALEDGEYDMYYGEVKLTADFDLSEFLTEGDREEEGGSLNYGIKKGYGFDAYIDAYLAAKDDARADAANAMYTLLLEQMPFVVICFEKQEIMTHRGVVTGVNAVPDNIFYGLENWKIDMTK